MSAKSDSRLLALMCAVAAISCSSGPMNGASRMEHLRERLEDANATDVMVIAHRGCWRDTAENSLAGIEECISIGVDMIEVDVRRTKDGRLVLMHDETVDRTTNGSGSIQDLDLAELKTLSLKPGAGGDAMPLTNFGIPTLREALQAARGRILVNLDIKADLYTQALQVVDEVGVADEIVMKMSAAPDDPRLDRSEFLGRTHFMPIVQQCNDDPARTCAAVFSEVVPRYSKYAPVAVEVVNETDAYLPKVSRRYEARAFACG